MGNRNIAVHLANTTHRIEPFLDWRKIVSRACMIAVTAIGVIIWILYLTEVR